MASQPLIEQRAQVAAIRDGRLGLVPVSRAGCARCASGQGCGAQLFGRHASSSTLLWLPSPLASSLRIGDEVRLTVAAELLQRSSLGLYAAPLLVMLTTVAIAAALQWPESVQALAALLSLLLSLLLLRRHLLLHRGVTAALIGVASAACSPEPSAQSAQTDYNGSAPP
ncbi:MAG TPA: SoxR reducing system RseC family protein [Permianibacter sp.]|nr:SoxR reducing system RseC family protein [Permianibacter sp.]